MTSLKSARRKSVSTLRSWTSSTKIWLISASDSSTSAEVCIRRRRTPVVMNVILVFGPNFESPLMMYPTSSPTVEHLSSLTRSAKPKAEILRGWVQTIFATEPFMVDIIWSRMNWTVWVLLPLPVSPEMITHWQALTVCTISSFMLHAGKFCRLRSIFCCVEVDSRAFRAAFNSKLILGSASLLCCWRSVPVIASLLSVERIDCSTLCRLISRKAPGSSSIVGILVSNHSTKLKIIGAPSSDAAAKCSAWRTALRRM